MKLTSGMCGSSWRLPAFFVFLLCAGGGAQASPLTMSEADHLLAVGLPSWALSPFLSFSRPQRLASPHLSEFFHLSLPPYHLQSVCFSQTIPPLLPISVKGSCTMQMLPTATPASAPTSTLVTGLASFRSRHLLAFVPAFLPCAGLLSVLFLFPGHSAFPRT